MWLFTFLHLLACTGSFLEMEAFSMLTPLVLSKWTSNEWWKNMFYISQCNVYRCVSWFNQQPPPTDSSEGFTPVLCGSQCVRGSVWKRGRKTAVKSSQSPASFGGQVWGGGVQEKLPASTSVTTTYHSPSSLTHISHLHFGILHSWWACDLRNMKNEG